MHCTLVPPGARSHAGPFIPTILALDSPRKWTLLSHFVDEKTEAKSSLVRHLAGKRWSLGGVPLASAHEPQLPHTEAA